jgi:hypothetical protein
MRIDREEWGEGGRSEHHRGTLTCSNRVNERNFGVEM